MLPIVGRRGANQIKTVGAIKDPNDEQMRKTFDICKADFEFQLDFKNATASRFAPGPLGICRVSWGF